MELKQRKGAIIRLGKAFGEIAENNGNNLSIKDSTVENWNELIETLKHHNGWFTPDNVRFALKQWANALNPKKVDAWLERYGKQLPEEPKGRTVGIIMAGNIPLVGLHDLITTLLSGHIAKVKLASGDEQLMKQVMHTLIEIEPELKDYVIDIERLKDFDAVIATGSNNTARYFEAYFGKYPNIIRKNRSSVAVLRGDEEEKDLKGLEQDIFTYFGLGCRNVSKLFIPEDYDLDTFFKAIYGAKDIIQHNKYANNYDHNRTVYLMKKLDFLDNGFLILMEHIGVSSPVSVLYYERYSSEEDLKQKIKQQEDQIQCIVSGKKHDGIDFGKAQQPELWDYADNVDTFDFLLKL